MLRSGVEAERIQEQALSSVECDIPDRWSISEYPQGDGDRRVV